MLSRVRSQDSGWPVWTSVRHSLMSASALSLLAALPQPLLSASCSMSLLPSHTSIDHFYDLIPSLCAAMGHASIFSQRVTSSARWCLDEPIHGARRPVSLVSSALSGIARTHTLLNAWPILKIITCTCRDPGRTLLQRDFQRSFSHWNNLICS